MKVNNEPITISISYRGGNIGITKDGRLTIGPNSPSETQARYDLGEATKDTFDALVTYLDRLAITINAIQSEGE